MVRLTGTHAHAWAFARTAFKVGNQCARASVSHAPIPVRRLRIIKIRGHLDAPQTQQVSKECLCALDVAADSRYVVHTLTQRHRPRNFRNWLRPCLCLDTCLVAVVDDHLRWWLAELSADSIRGFIDSPARAARRDFENGTVGIIEVDRLEVMAVKGAFHG